ncbi:hypothetical protein OG689_10615 [Kitasatospora sp. NBC_00240]|uniref:hypothetical protein n=1 Tax=Kitasatospora sp. NBC_00240 TaxID=2903567 RepID=UPI0022597179|nr:hypothetical protein [Kitasatospora sp. NBC_00240]MCX5209735.1 hypothetical protein [Kitasatospora sp. NBC_00240]
MADIQNPMPDLSDYDWLEFVSYVWKTENEGFTYAYENYSPDFESTDMQALAADMGRFRTYFIDNVDKVEQWATAIGWEAAVNLHNDHVDESRQRDQDACLWGVRCADGYVVHERSEADRDAFIARSRGNSSYRQPAALLHRDVPGGDWTDSPLPASV